MRATLEKARPKPKTVPARIDPVSAEASDLEGIERWRADPVAFAIEALGVTPWSRQAKLLRDIVTHPRVAVRSGHKVGKSTTAAIIALWFSYCFDEARVIITAPTHRQIQGIIWREIRRLYNGAKMPLGGHLNQTPGAGLKYEDESHVVGFSTAEPERMAGISGANVLFIVDEASGVAEQIFEAIEGNRAGGARLVLFSNPTQVTGTFYDAFNTKREFWFPVHIRSDDQNIPKIPGMATAAWCAEKLREWGEDNPLYQVRVLGNFPKGATNTVITLGQVDAAIQRWEEREETTDRLELGVDVARFGDDSTVIAPRRGKVVFPPITVHGFDVVEVTGKVLETVRALRTDEKEKPIVKVDSIGVGAGVADLLKQHAKELHLIEVNVAEKSDAEDDFSNLRSQLWFGVAKWLDDGGILPPTEGRLDAELLAPTYSFDLRGRRKVESKDDIKKRLQRSPDMADAVALAVYAKRRAAPAPPPPDIEARGAFDTRALHDTF